jgi:hypothetical protein
MKLRNCLVLISVFFALHPAFAQMNPDSPNADETFASFFARITRGGGFPGIYLEAPEKTQIQFLKTIRRGFWVGLRENLRKDLRQQGVDLWNDWYKQDNSFQVILNSEQKRSVIRTALREQIKRDQNECSPNCPLAEQILKSRWQDLDSFSRQEFAKTLVFSVSLFGDKSLLQHLGDLYHHSSSEIEASTRIRILSNLNFISAVQELGYLGPIYFRGITAPDPQNPKGHVILLNEEMLYKHSPFDSEVLKTLEVVGILVHELSHVFQDSKGLSMGLDIQVRSAEAALLLEGSAEYLAEQAMSRAARLEPAPSALSLFVTEQAVEIVYRPGNESTGQLFPYTIGLPFAAALYSQVGATEENHLTEKILQFLGGQQSLKDWLKTF